MKNKVLALVGILVLVACFAAGCGGGGKPSPKSAQQKAQAASNALQGSVYQSKNNVEFRNYNWRQEIADDPATILWCTFFPPGLSGVTDGTTPGQPFTVPIAGKLTSSNKRPYDATAYSDRGNYTFTEHEVPGPDHMYGSSSEYRYGFGPNGKSDYQDFTLFASYCTTQPKVWQANTPIITATSVTLNSISKAATAALKSGDAAKATEILSQAGNVKKSK